MWKLFLSWAVLKVGLRSVGWLAVMVPLAFLFKTVGAPLLAILGVFALPLLVILALLGLPIIVVIVFTMLLLGALGAHSGIGANVAPAAFLANLGIAVAKIVIPILVVWWLVSWLFRSAWWNKPKGAGDEPLTGDVT